MNEDDGAHNSLSFAHRRVCESTEPARSAVATCSTSAHDTARLSEKCEGRKGRAEQAKARAVRIYPRLRWRPFTTSTSYVARCPCVLRDDLEEKGLWVQQALHFILENE